MPLDDDPTFRRLWGKAVGSFHKERAKAPPQRTWRDGLTTAAELQSKQFKPVRIILPDLIPEGVTLVAGKPKVGKSWLALDVGLAVADETRFVLGDKRPVHGDALYLALEDNERRLKKRIDKVLQGATAPKRLQFHTEWKRMDHGGLDDIEAWIKSVPEPRLIWIDTLAKIRALAGRNEQAYAADYRAIEGVQKLAGQYGVAIVLNTHLRKAPSEDDPFDEVSGTLGQTGAADTIIVMKRHSGMMKIYVRGRDIEEAEFAAEFNRNTCRWRIVGGADEVFRSQERQKIIAVLKDGGTDKDGKPKSMSVAEIMAATERTDRQAMYALLWKMQQAGEIVSTGRGLYALPDTDPLKGVEIVENEPFETHRTSEAADNADVSGTNESQRESQRNLNATDSVEIPFRSTEAAKPLASNGNSSKSQHLNDLNGPEADDFPELPECLRRTPPDGGGYDFAKGLPPAQVMAQVQIREVWPPSAWPLGDDVFDINPRWRQPAI
jgi:AAA domain-containing protein